MDGFISRQAAIDATWFEPSYTDPLNVLTEVRDRLEALAYAPTIDAVQVVRCKDCKNWRESHSEDEESYCYIDGRTTDSTDYCSWGERKE